MVAGLKIEMVEGELQSTPRIIMMTSSNENIFRVTGHLCWEFTGPGEFPAQRPVTRSFDVFFCARINDWVNNREAGDLRRHRGHYDVNVMYALVGIPITSIHVDACELCLFYTLVMWTYVSPPKLHGMNRSNPIIKIKILSVSKIQLKWRLSSRPINVLTKMCWCHGHVVKQTRSFH